MDSKTEGCCKWKTGSKTIGIVSVIGSSTSICGMIKVLLEQFLTNSTSNKMDSLYSALRNPEKIIVTIILLQLTQLISSIFLLIGLYKNNPLFMKPWIIFMPIREMVLLVFAIICVWVPFVLFNLDISTKNIRNFIPILAAVGALFATALTLFFWMVVKDAMDEMEAAISNKIMEKEMTYLNENVSANRASHKIPKIRQIENE